MNILHINYIDVTGGRFNGYSMQQILGKSHNVEMAVWDKVSDEPRVHSIRPNWYPSFVRRNKERFLGGWTLPIQDYFKRADVVHLQLLHAGAYFSILSLPMLSRLKPLVWTIHDSWAMTGGCLHSFDCDRWLTGCSPPCPYPRAESLLAHQLPALSWRIKKQVFDKTKMDLVVASKWMQDRVNRSPLLSRFSCHLIPFGVDVETFCPRPTRESRKRLGIRPNQKVIAFRDAGSKNPFKGTRWIREALEIYEPPGPTCLLILEDGRGFKSLSSKYDVVTPGWIEGDRLASALSAADVFLMPSIQEAFGLMAVEAMACGTPVVVFEGTALPDIIRAEAGLAVPAKDSAALADAIRRLLTNDGLLDKMGRCGRQIVEREYSFQLYAERHIALYEDAIERHYRSADV